MARSLCELVPSPDTCSSGLRDQETFLSALVGGKVKVTDDTDEFSTPGRIVLPGDSIFDNKSYAGGGPDVVAQFREEFVSRWKCTLLAVDDDVTTGVVRQVRLLLPGATHPVVSVGGNDALGYADLLQQKVGSVAEALSIPGDAQDQFAMNYASMIRAVSAEAPGLWT